MAEPTTPVAEPTVPLQPFRRHLDEPETTLARGVGERSLGWWRGPTTNPQWTETAPTLRVAPERPARVGQRRSTRAASRVPFDRVAPSVDAPDQPRLTVRITPAPSIGSDETTTGRRSRSASTAPTASSASVVSETPATNGHARSTPAPTLDLSAASRSEVDQLVDRLYDGFVRKLRIERERRGR